MHDYLKTIIFSHFERREMLFIHIVHFISLLALLQKGDMVIGVVDIAGE